MVVYRADLLKLLVLLLHNITNQLKLVKNLKTSIIEMSQREMQLFNAFKEASAKNPSLTYEEFIKTMK